MCNKEKKLENNENLESITKFYSLLEDVQEEVPVSVIKLASKLGIRVFRTNLPADISGFIKQDIDGSIVIRVNKNHYPTRRRFTIAHEIAHFILHKDSIGEGIVDRTVSDGCMYRSDTVSGIEEAQANHMAAEILMPKYKIVNLIKNEEIRTIKGLAEKFNVSEQAMKIRLKKLGYEVY